jgi:hypothetical protein
MATSWPWSISRCSAQGTRGWSGPTQPTFVAYDLVSLRRLPSEMTISSLPSFAIAAMTSSAAIWADASSWRVLLPNTDSLYVRQLVDERGEEVGPSIPRGDGVEDAVADDHGFVPTAAGREQVAVGKPVAGKCSGAQRLRDDDSSDDALGLKQGRISRTHCSRSRWRTRGVVRRSSSTRMLSRSSSCRSSSKERPGLSSRRIARVASIRSSEPCPPRPALAPTPATSATAARRVTRSPRPSFGRSLGVGLRHGTPARTSSHISLAPSSRQHASRHRASTFV